MPTPGQATLKAALLAVFQNQNDAATAADQLATAIDNHIMLSTTTVVGTVTTGPGAGGAVTGSGSF